MESYISKRFLVKDKISLAKFLILQLKPAKKQELAEAKEEPKAKRKSAKAEKGAKKQ